MGAALDRGRESDDPEVRREAYAEVQRIFRENFYLGWSAHAFWSVAASPNVHDLVNWTAPDRRAGHAVGGWAAPDVAGVAGPVIDRLPRPQDPFGAPPPPGEGMMGAARSGGPAVGRPPTVGRETKRGTRR